MQSVEVWHGDSYNEYSLIVVYTRPLIHSLYQKTSYNQARGLANKFEKQ